MKKQEVLFSNEQYRLISLWALAETALGGFLHAFKIPVTGFLVGGFAVLAIGMLALTTKSAWKTILKATAIVLLIKGIASPHSPPMAYIAVAFQGILGALCYALLPGKLANYVFCIIAMLESALQKVLITTLIFGMEFWKALDQFISDIQHFFHVPQSGSFSLGLIFTFLSLYFLWGIILGYWLTKLPQQLTDRKERYLRLIAKGDDQNIPLRQKKKYGLMVLGILLFLMSFLILFSSQKAGLEKALMAVARSLLVVLFLYFLVRPLLQYLIKKWADKNQSKYQTELNHVLSMMPDLRLQVAPIYKYVSQEYKGINRLKEFVLALFVIALFSSKDE